MADRCEAIGPLGSRLTRDTSESCEIYGLVAVWQYIQVPSMYFMTINRCGDETMRVSRFIAYKPIICKGFNLDGIFDTIRKELYEVVVRTIYAWIRRPENA